MPKPQLKNSGAPPYNGSKIRRLQQPWQRKLNPIARNLFSHKQVFSEVDFMKSRFLILAALCGLVFGLPQDGFAQRQGQTELSTVQRLDVMSSKLDLMRRSLNSAVAAMPENK